MVLFGAMSVGPDYAGQRDFLRLGVHADFALAFHNEVAVRQDFFDGDANRRRQIIRTRVVVPLASLLMPPVDAKVFKVEQQRAKAGAIV